jgi:hypothetical protein
MRHLTQAESARLTAVAERTHRNVDETAGMLLLAAAQGDDSALLALADRLEEIGRPDQAAKIRAAIEALDREALTPEDEGATYVAEWWVKNNLNACLQMARYAYDCAGPGAGREERAAQAMAPRLKQAFKKGQGVLLAGAASVYDLPLELCLHATPAALDRLNWLPRARRLISMVSTQPLLTLRERAACRRAALPRMPGGVDLTPVPQGGDCDGGQPPGMKRRA